MNWEHPSRFVFKAIKCETYAYVNTIRLPLISFISFILLSAYATATASVYYRFGKTNAQ